MAIDTLHDHGRANTAVLYAHQSAVRALCRSRLVDPGEAEDAARTTFDRAHQALPDFDPDRQLWPWLAAIAADVCADVLRAHRSVPLSTWDEDPDAHRVIDLTDELDLRTGR